MPPVPTPGGTMTPQEMSAIAGNMRAAAQALHEYAAKLRTVANGAYAETLNPVVSLLGAGTWSGPYPAQATDEIEAWDKRLTGPGREALVALAASWDSLADLLLNNAAAESAAVKQAQQAADKKK